MPPLHRTRYNASFMYSPAWSNWFGSITSARGAIARPHVARPAMLGVFQVQRSLCAMQAVLEGLLCTRTTVQTR